MRLLPCATLAAMLDPKSLTARRDEIVTNCRSRGIVVDIDETIAGSERVAELQTALNEANRLRNEHRGRGKRKLEPAEREAHVAEGRRLKEEAGRLESELSAAREGFLERLREIPNFAHPDAPVGGEEDFKELRRWGAAPSFDFEARDHLELGTMLDLVDFEAGARVTGQKFYFLKNEAVLLELALQRLVLERVSERGFVLHATPDLARPEIVDGLGYSPRGEETQIYSLANADLCLIGTSEITLGGLLAGSILEEEQLPLRLAGVSHCFRTEAGAAGRESKGLYRVHQFSKVEMFVFCRPEDSERLHEELLTIEEEIFQALEIPYRVIDTATADLGAPAYRKFDLEGWMPGRGEAGDYGELTSTSNCTDYQARRLRVRFRRKGSKKTEFVHMLNGTGVAIPRTVLAILENHQQADGSIRIPSALQPHLGRDRIGPRA
ncbi:MAG: serine--tRNA ligase [Myxococcota bacterium]